MKRALESSLLLWKNTQTKKPLILEGARQVGKTYLVNSFAAQHYKNVFHFNFEEAPNLRNCFTNSLSPADIIQRLEIFANKQISAKTDLIFFDEIQLCSEALTSLKYFYEKNPEYNIVGAGSLLGVALNRKTSFPVGKVELLTLYPLSFIEFLNAIDKGMLAEFIQKGLKGDNTFHEELLYLFKLYTFIGGMPEVIINYIKNKDLAIVRKIQNQILLTYDRDFSKYATPSETLKIRQIWDSVPSQLAKENKKFIFTAVAKSARAREYETALRWLKDAGLINISYLVETPKIPLEVVKDINAFKVFLLDTGLLCAKTDLPATSILDPEATLFTQFQGASFENIISQELIANNIGKLYYWGISNKAEVDFLLQINDRVIPLEAKSGNNRKSRSLTSYINRYNPKQAFRVGIRGYSTSGEIVELPVYGLKEVLKG